MNNSTTNNLKRAFSATLGLVIFVLATSCSRIENKISPDDIKGTWYLNKWTTYHTLTFDDSTVLADNNIDTIFTFDYSVLNNSLILTTLYGDKIFVNKIITLTKDTLVLDGVRGTKEMRSYSRIKKVFNK